MAEEIKKYLDNPGLQSYDAKIKNYIGKKDAAVLDASKVNVVKKETAEQGYSATYEITQNGVKVGSSINIPKDFLVKDAKLKVVETENVPYEGAHVGDKYIDFTLNTPEETEEKHIYLPVNDLVDTYAADEVTLHLDGATNTFSVKEIEIAKVSGLQTALDAKALGADLTAEIARAKAAELANDNAITAEATAARAAELKLTNDLADEVVRAKAAEEANATAIAAEKTRAEAAEGALDTRVGALETSVDGLATIAKTGNVKDLIQSEDDVLILNCNL